MQVQQCQSALAVLGVEYAITRVFKRFYYELADFRLVINHKDCCHDVVVARRLSATLNNLGYFLSAMSSIIAATMLMV